MTATPSRHWIARSARIKPCTPAGYIYSRCCASPVGSLAIALHGICKGGASPCEQQWLGKRGKPRDGSIICDTKVVYPASDTKARPYYNPFND